MSDNSQTDQAKRRKRLGVILTVIFAIALIMGPGPGITIGFINAPEPLWGLPAVYVWGLLWYVVEVSVVVVAYFFVWEKDNNSDV